MRGMGADMLTRSRFYAPPRLALTCALFFLTGCTAVDVGVGVQPLTTPTAAPTMIASAIDVRAESSAGLVAVSAPDDGDVHVITVSEPVIVFMPGSAAIEPLAAWSSGDEYFVMRADGGRGLRLRASWQGVWLTDSNGGGQVALDVALRSHAEPDADYQYVDQALSSEFWADYPTRQGALLDSTLYLTEVGDHDLRAVVTVNVEDYTGGAAVSAEAVYETRLRVLMAPETFPTSVEAFAPGFAELESEFIFLDWRGWAFGPCYVQTDSYPDATRALDAACTAFESGEWVDAGAALHDALMATEGDSPLQNRLRQQLGTLAAGVGEWNIAVRHFREGLAIAHGSADALDVAIALNNLGVALIEAGFQEEGKTLLWQAIGVHDQLDDYPGALIPWITMAGIEESNDSFAWIVPELQGYGLLQAEDASRWAAQIDS